MEYLYLNQSECIAPHGERKDLGRVLSAEEIPVHPSVFESNETYTPRFVKEVFDRLPHSIERDIEAIGKEIGFKPRIRVIDGIVRGKETFPLEEITPDISQGCISFHYSSTDIRLDKRPPEKTGFGLAFREFFQDGMQTQHSIPDEKLREYFLGDIAKCYSWIPLNMSHFSYEGMLAFRNIALLVNNLGLQHTQGYTKEWQP